MSTVRFLTVRIEFPGNISAELIKRTVLQLQSDLDAEVENTLETIGEQIQDDTFARNVNVSVRSQF